MLPNWLFSKLLLLNLNAIKLLKLAFRLNSAVLNTTRCLQKSFMFNGSVQKLSGSMVPTFQRLVDTILRMITWRCLFSSFPGFSSILLRANWAPNSAYVFYPMLLHKWNLTSFNKTPLPDISWLMFFKCCE